MRFVRFSTSPTKRISYYGFLEELLEFDVFVDSKWSDVITVPYVSDWISHYRVTRNWQTGEREHMKEGSGYSSMWRTNFELWRGFTATKQCYNYTVELLLITGSTVSSTSEKICVGPGSPASDQLKFWIFTTLFAMIGVSIIGTAVFHEHRRESILKQNHRIKFEHEF
ncbi:hypothetical protein Y032_0101g3366 [Ancylostoma ceylanicum]|uniref:Uncharacterized protein n=1 Tax=Ancylostoma ceylanicum TaxID=53326 RepID=A0A016THP7_9BILA|nr:hypothetical protein Y032_0101g3366 [Ancylostoma ceylanicum]